MDNHVKMIFLPTIKTAKLCKTKQSFKSLSIYFFFFAKLSKVYTHTHKTGLQCIKKSYIKL